MSLIITGVIDGPLSGGLPKAIELTASADIADLSVYGLESANNGGGAAGAEFTGFSGPLAAGESIYVASEETGFTAFFGNAPDYTGAVASINGDDAILLYENGTVIDSFGVPDVDGTGERWEYLDGWAYRVSGTGPDGATFMPGNWTFSGPDALDGESDNATAAVPFPAGSYAPAGGARELIAAEDFDGGALGLLAGFDPATGNLDGGPGDFFGVGSIDGWPQGAGLPFSLADDSVADVSGGGVFAGDLEGVYGQAADGADAFFGVSDSDEFDTAQTASWTFDIAGFTDLALSIGMGGIADGDSFGGFGPQTLSFTYAIDGVPVGTAFALAATTETGGFDFRPMDSGAVTPDAGVLEVTGDAAVIKLLAEDGSEAANTFLDKTPPAGDGAGTLDSFVTALAGAGSTLTLTLTADFPFEAMAFDDIAITGVADGTPAEPAVLVSESDGGTEVTEGGAGDSYEVVLADRPTADVTVTVVTDAEVTAGPTTLTFTPDDWDVPQTVTVTAVDDAEVELSHTGLVSHAAASADPDYDGIAVADVVADINDNDIPVVLVSEVQGAGAASPLDGEIVTIEAVVVGDFQDGDADGSRNLSGFYVQEEDADTDDDPLTSEGLFVFDDGFGVDVTPGDVVRITGTVDEFFGETQLDTISAVEVVGTSALPGAAEIDLPAAAATTSQDGDFQPDLEAYEGMLVRFPETLTITEQFQLDRFNEIKLVAGERPYQFTQTNLPSVPGYAAFLEELGARTITYDDGLNVQNAPISDLDGFGPVYGTATAPRMGDTIEGLSGVLSYQWAGNSASGATWRVRATEDGENAFESANPREPEPEDTGGRLTVASFNVLNFFTTLDTNPGSFNGPNITGPNEDQEPRGAEDLTGFGIAPATAEFDRQLAKLLTAIEDLSADVLGLIEIENDPEGDTSIQALIDAINEVLGPNTYDYIDTGTVGTDAIKVGLIYRPDSVTPVGDYAILDKTVDERFDSDNQRPTVAQSFAEAGTGEVFTVAVNHLKSKGSPAGNPGDEDIGDGQAASNGTRTEAAEALVDWLATDPTGSGDPDFMIIGDLNAYAMEDPIRAITEGADDVPGTEDDYTDLAQDFVGPEAYSYLFDGQLGTLDYALANGPMAEQVTGVTEWHINSDEADALDYNLNFGRDPDIFDASVPYRASDHDPVVVGLDLGGGAEPVLASAGIGFDTGGFLPRLVYSEDGAAQESVLQIPYVRLRDPQDAVPISVEAIDSEDSFSLFGREFSLPVRDWATVRLDGTIAVRDGEDGAFGRDARSIEGDEALAIAIEEDAPFDFAGGAQIRLSGISAHETVTAEAWLDGALVGSFASAGDTIEIAPAGEGLDRIVLRADGDTDFTVAAAEFRDLFAEDSLLA